MEIDDHLLIAIVQRVGHIGRSLFAIRFKGIGYRDGQDVPSAQTTIPGFLEGGEGGSILLQIEVSAQVLDVGQVIVVGFRVAGD
jgi:hypothetical protein